MIRSLSFAAFVVFGSLSMVQDSFAQNYGMGGSRNVRSATRNFLYNRPTVSPYLNLARPDSNSGFSNYFTMVLPQVERQQQDRAQQHQTARMQSELNQVQSQVVQNQQQAAGMMFTGRNGWSSRGISRFGLYLNYYPGMSRIARR